MPIPARFSFEFGEGAPRKPNTAAGKTVKAALTAVDVRKNWRRVTGDELDWGLVFIYLLGTRGGICMQLC
jgi:hypothetical protein